MDWVTNLFSSQQIVFQLEKLHALGFKPILLIGCPKKTSKVMMPLHATLSTAAKTCLANMEEVFKMMFEGEIVCI